MADDLQIRIFVNKVPAHQEPLRGTLELGRQVPGEGAPFYRHGGDSCDRLVIARKDVDYVSRKQVRIECRAEGRVYVENVSEVRPVAVENGPVLPPKDGRKPPEGRELDVPLTLSFGNIAVRIERAPRTEDSLQSLPDVTTPPNYSLRTLPRFPGLLFPKDDEAAGEQQQREVLRWLQSSMSVFQSAATSSEFFQKAAQAIVDIAGLDTGRILLLENDRWQTRASATGPSDTDDDDWRPSLRVLNRLLSEKKTFWELPNSLLDAMNSLRNVSLVVASPLRAANGDVIGAVYGDRRRGASTADGPSGEPRISEVEAMLVELIATAVAAGMARLRQEQAALEERVRFEQFFSRELSESLAEQPDLLKGRAEEVTLLFCDIRGFSRVSERLGPEKTVAWLGHVMETLSDCVLAHEGVLVDYIGDELVAMWGAPSAQPQHADLACRAAIDMLKALPALNERWQSALGAPMAFGIGINSGVAQVGNTGTRHKFKYGPLGNTVNLASRVQGATKQLRVPILITAATRRQLGGDLAARRLCTVRVVNIAEPVDLYELAFSEGAAWRELNGVYERALAALEKEDFPCAARVAGELLEKWPDDGPSRLLLGRASQALLHPTAKFDRVVTLTEK